MLRNASHYFPAIREKPEGRGYNDLPLTSPYQPGRGLPIERSVSLKSITNASRVPGNRFRGRPMVEGEGGGPSLVPARIEHLVWMQIQSLSVETKARNFQALYVFESLDTIGAKYVRPAFRPVSETKTRKNHTAGCVAL